MGNKKKLKCIIMPGILIFISLTLTSCKNNDLKNNVESNYSHNTNASNKEVKDSNSNTLSNSQNTNTSIEESNDSLNELALAPASIGDKEGYIDKKGDWVIEPKYDAAYCFQDGIAVVGVNNKYGLIDKKGNWIVEPKFKELEFFSKGLAPAQDQNDKWGYINRKGEWAVPPTFEAELTTDINIFTEGVAGVSLLEENDSYGFIAN